MAEIRPTCLDIFLNQLILSFYFVLDKYFSVYEFIEFLRAKTAQTNYAVCFFCLNCQSIRVFGTDFTG